MEFVYVVKRADLFDLSFPHGFVARGPGLDAGTLSGAGKGAGAGTGEGSAAGTAAGSGSAAGSAAGTGSGAGAAPAAVKAAPANGVALPAADRVARWTAAIRGKGFFLERRHAEQDSSFKQIIPYTLVMHGDEILLLRRLGKGGEARLHGKLSIGVGGHINPVDLDGADDVLDAGCRRELEEEIEIRCPYTLAPVGAINDDSSDVGSVHFGFVNVARCETRDVAIRETDVLEGSFVSLAALREIAREERGRFETWSALIVDRLDELLR